MKDSSYFVPGTALNTLYANDMNLSSKEFMLEIWLDDPTTPWRRMFTLRECLANIEMLANGSTFRICCHFNLRDIGDGIYCKQGTGMTVIKEEGVLTNLFTPSLQMSPSKIRH
ncbi:hypothetical protein [Dictyobacter formicarum]|uniref:F-box associated domain-containing protein n=1 Tax=Dictyobacter formicarum TaxID=2778368 RepID=A0ABQ3VLV4_9CHLR|nr:hypothetical protein [Dictyobacter formicarum]GHO86689.1 hypothetical protein KSZ_46950 [Dictyobacter formicarum]